MSLSSLIPELCELAEDLRAQGQSPDRIEQTLEAHVRMRWPKGREWKFLCNACDDTGLLITMETVRLYGEMLIPMGRPCFCTLGNRFRKAPPSEQDYTKAGQAKPKPMTRFGR
jgi:hypothetical protein